MNPYLRAAQKRPELKQEAAERLQQRDDRGKPEQQEKPKAKQAKTKAKR